MLFSELKKHIKTEKSAPAYLITGEDSFLVLSAVNQFKALSGDMADFNLSELNSPESASVIREACEILPLAADKRVVTVSGCKADLTPLLKYFENPCPTTVLVFISPKPENNLSKIMSKLTIVDCSKLDRQTIINWIAHKTKEYSSSITEGGAKLLIDYCGGDMAKISSELSKLCSYRYDGVITEEDVAELTSPTLDFKIYELSEAVATKQPHKTAVMLKNLLNGGEAPIALLGLLYAHFRRLLYVAITPPYDRMAADLGVRNDYVIKKAREQASRLTPVKIKRICDDLQRADYDVKSGKINDKVALELTVLRALTV